VYLASSSTARTNPGGTSQLFPVSRALVMWQLASILRAQIQSGELPPGRIMASEATLMQEHGLARGTVRKAIDALVQEGLVNRVQGRGTFVRR
jgi:DNA-binding GntR family transcriptional regulator